MIHFIVNETDKAQCPVCWEETKTGVYQRLQRELRKDDNDVKLFAILTNTSYEDLWESNREDLSAGIYQAVAFVGNQPQDFKTKPKPKTFKIGGATVLLPEKLAKLTVGQNFEMRDKLIQAKKDGHPLEALLSIALAIYIQPLVDNGPFDPARARELDLEIQELPIGDVWPAGFFLLTRLNNSGLGGMRLWFQMRLQRIKSRLPWLRRLGWTSSSPSSASARSTNMPPGSASSRGSFSRSPLMNSSPSSSSGTSKGNTTNGSMP